MKPTVILVSALATLAAAAPAAEKKVEARGFAFDANLFNGFNGFNGVNIAYLNSLNNLNLGFLEILANRNNFNINQFAPLFAIQGNQLRVEDLLLLQQAADFQRIFEVGLLDNFDLATLQFGGFNNGIGGLLNTGLLGLGALDLNSFIGPQVVTQVQTVASQFLIAKN